MQTKRSRFASRVIDVKVTEDLRGQIRDSLEKLLSTHNTVLTGQMKRDKADMPVREDAHNLA